jgi:hypothetical protein
MGFDNWGIYYLYWCINGFHLPGGLYTGEEGLGYIKELQDI